MLLAGLDCGASKVIGIEKEAKLFEDGEEEDCGGWACIVNSGRVAELKTATSNPKPFTLRRVQGAGSCDGTPVLL